MWLMTTRGFYSVVKHNEMVDTVMIRARHEKDLKALQDLLPNAVIVYTDYADYPCRFIVDKTEWENAATRLAEEVDYSNFKSEVGARDPKRASLYSKVWGVMLGAEKARKTSLWPDDYPRDTAGAWSDKDWQDRFPDLFPDGGEAQRIADDVFAPLPPLLTTGNSRSVRRSRGKSGRKGGQR